MLEILKDMQSQGIFNLLPNDDLDGFIKNAGTILEIDTKYGFIQKYLKNMDHQLTHKHNVDLSNVISDFSDKFSFEMFDLSFTSNDCSNGIRQKDISFGKAGTGSFGIEMTNSTFTLEERKLLKLINHYYITLMNKSTFDDSYFYIPLESLKLVFTNKNNFKVKKAIVDTCTSINNKVIYWDISKTRYSKRFEKSKLNNGNKEKLVDISVLYLPMKNKNGIDGEATEIKGIICRISKFMKLRYGLKQISNRFPIKSLSSNYLEFMIAEKIDYRLNMLSVADAKVNNKRKKNAKNGNYVIQKSKYKRDLRELADGIYVYRYRKQRGDTYLSKILNDPNSLKSIIDFIEATINVVRNLSTTCSCQPFIVTTENNFYLPLYAYDNKQWLSAVEVYTALVVKTKSSKRGYVKKLLENGCMYLEIRF